MLEDYLMIRKNFPEWHNKLSLDDSQINYFLESGCMCPLVEKDKLGRQVIFYGCTPFDTVKFKSIDVIRLNALVYANFLQDENIQVGGLVVIYDASILTMQALNAFTISEIHNWFTGIKKGLLKIIIKSMLNIPMHF